MRMTGNYKDGRTAHPLLFIWHGMIHRCYNNTNPRYKDYGGRGIQVCQQWIDNFWQFVADIGERPDKSYTIERKNNDGNYEPMNVIWATKKEQSRNRYNTILLTFQNQTKSLRQWCEELLLNPGVVYTRLRRGWSVDEALTILPNTSSNTDHLITYKNQTERLKDWSTITGLKQSTIRMRLKYGWGIEQALTLDLNRMELKVPRCVQCNKFVSLNTEVDPEVENLDVDDDGNVTAEVRIVNQCIDCGEELTEASISMEDVVDFTKIVHDVTKCKSTGLSDISIEETSSTRTERVEGVGRGQKKYYGAEVTCRVFCMSCGADTEVVLQDDVQASGMEVM